MARIFRFLVVAASALILLVTGCSLIDEALEECKESLKLTCHLRLVTNVKVQLMTQLSDKRDEALREALEKHLDNVFSEYARDVDLSFYAADEEGRRLEHRTAIMEAEQATYEIELPARDYDLQALANIGTESHVRLTGDEFCNTAQVSQPVTDLMPSQTAGLFATRMPLTVHRDESESFDVNLYMFNSAVAMVVHRDSCEYVSASCELLELSDGFMVQDSLFTFSKPTRFASVEVPVDTVGYESNWRTTPALFCGVAFPSVDAGTKADGEEETLWQVAVNVELPDETVTRTVISVSTPLPAGELIVLRGWLHANGVYEPEPVPDVMVCGISVTLNWEEGMHYNPEL